MTGKFAEFSNSILNLERKVNTFPILLWVGTSVHWFDRSNAIIYGGTEPKQGEGGRAIFLLTSSNVSQPVCDAETCTVEGKDPKTISCTNCYRTLHMVCDINLRKRKTQSVPKVIKEVIKFLIIN